MDFEFKVTGLDGSVITMSFNDFYFESDNLENVVERFKSFLQAAGYDISQFEESE